MTVEAIDGEGVGTSDGACIARDPRKEQELGKGSKEITGVGIGADLYIKESYPNGSSVC